MESFAKGKELFRNGLLSEAVLAFEAEVTRQPGNVDAWRLLGTVHAENDDDQQVGSAPLLKSSAWEPISHLAAHENERAHPSALGNLGCMSLLVML